MRQRVHNYDPQGRGPEFSSAATADRVLDYLRDSPTCSVRDIARALSIGTGTAHRALDRLQFDRAVIARTKTGTGDGYPSEYNLADHVR